MPLREVGFLGIRHVGLRTGEGVRGRGPRVTDWCLVWSGDTSLPVLAHPPGRLPSGRAREPSDRDPSERGKPLTKGPRDLGLLLPYKNSERSPFRKKKEVFLQFEILGYPLDLSDVDLRTQGEDP